MELNDPRHAGALFILAVMLERKRLFKVKAQLNQDGQRAFVYEHAQTGDLFTIPDPNLQLDQLEEVQRDVAELLRVGVGASTVSATPPSVSESIPTEMATSNESDFIPAASPNVT
jgi:hypothetical protein